MGFNVNISFYKVKRTDKNMESNLPKVCDNMNLLDPLKAEKKA